MRFQNNTIEKRVANAILDAERLLHPDSKMIHTLRLKRDWKYNSGSSEQIIKKLLSVKSAMKVFTYYPDNANTKAIGTYGNGEMRINEYMLPTMTHTAIVGNLLHEYSHHSGFAHYSPFWTSNIKTKDKCLFSVPYFISENVGLWL